MSASKNKPFSLTHSLVGLVLCIAHMAVVRHVAPGRGLGLRFTAIKETDRPTRYAADGQASQSVSRGCVPIRAISNPVCEACVVLEGHCLSGCAASGRFLLNAASPRDEKQPRCSDHQEYEQTEHRGQQSKSVELTLSEVVTPDEDDVLAPALRGDCREVAAGKE